MISLLQHISSIISKSIVMGFLSLFAFLFSATHAETALAASDAKASDATVTTTRGLLFEIKSGEHTAYLFGSIHIAKADFYPMSPKVEAAYLQADTVAIEADTTDAQAMQAMMPKLSYVAPDKLENHVTPATWSSMKSVFGPAIEQMQGFKPFVVTSGLAMQVGMQMGYDPKQGIDLHFINRAKTDKKSLVELESLDFQASILGGLSDEDGDAMLASTIESLKNREFFKDLSSIETAWKAADADGIAKLFVDAANKDAASKKMMKMLMDDRNEGMVTKINSMMASGKKLFVVVGAGHLAGEKSVVDLLKKQGLTVTQIR